MGLLTEFFKKDSPPMAIAPGAEVMETEVVNQPPPPTSIHNRNAMAVYGGANLLYSWSFDGEKDFGEMGDPKNYKLNYDILRIRSWQAFIESEVAQIVLKKYTLWIIGAGLNLKCEPSKDVLNAEGITVDPESFNQAVESRWNVYAKSRQASYNGMKNLHKLAKEAHKNAIIGGDVLVILRFVDNEIKVQLIDGAHVQSPVAGSEWFPSILPNGNTLVNGIELDARGQHVAYYVCKQLPEFGYDRIEAKIGGLTMAYMVYGLEYRLDNYRGMPLIACVLETMKKLERYKEATLGSAEERQKIVYQITHGDNSEGTNPLATQIAKAHNADAGSSEALPEDINGRQLADRVAASTNKQTFNMPIDSKLETLESKNELYFKDFYTINIDVVCATIGIPPNVAMSSYHDSFSASRAATKDWEHTINVFRTDFSDQFYQPIYDAWLTTQILKKKINAPGYILAMTMNEYMIMGAYRNCRFTGPMFPHIDPLKEVQAERLKMGTLMAHFPLTTGEQATETLGGGDSDSNVRQVSEELKDASANGLEAIPVGQMVNDGGDNDNPDDKKPKKKP